MSIDVVDLRNFYAHQLGVVARRFVGRSIRGRWTDTRAMRVLGIGYATPYLGLFREEAERCLAFMPGTQGVVKWPSARPALTALVDESDMPLPDGAVDLRVAGACAGDVAATPAQLLREVWRVLSAGGKLLAVVPNRRGLWARMDTTPFGHGRPYSRSQIIHLLRETWFTPMGWDEALYVPPIGRRWFLRSAVGLGARRRDDLGAFCRRAYRGSDQAGLSRDSGAQREAPAGAGAGTCARARAGRRRGRDLIARRLV